MNNQFGGGGGGYGAGAPAGGPMAPGQLDVGDVLRTTFRAMQGALGPVLGCALIVAVPTMITSFGIRVLVYMVLVGTGSGPPDMEALQRVALVGSAAYLLSLGVLIVTGAVGQGGIMYAVAEHLSGRSPSFGTALRAGISRMVPVVLSSLIVTVVLVIGLFMCVLPGLVAFVFLCMTVPVCVVERLGPIDSITRGVALSEGNRLPIVLAFLAMTVGLVVVSCCVMTPAIGLAAVQGASAAGSGDLRELYNPLSIQQIVSALFQIPVMLVATMANSTMIAVIYAKLRGLRDGVDAQAIASVFG